MASRILINGRHFRNIRRIGSRFGASVITLLVISVVVFLLMNFKGPSEIAMGVLGRDVSQEQLASFVQANNLDLPFIERYGIWIGSAIQGDLGTSVITGRAVADDVRPRLAVSLVLAGISSTLGILFGIATGVFLARRAGSGTDFRSVIGLLALSALPEFIVGITLYMLFVILLGWLPSESSFAFSFGSIQDRAVAFILPVLTLAILIVPQVARVTRITMVEALSSGYVSTARLRGLSDRQVVWAHAFRNSLPPLASVIGLNVIFAMTGTLVVETVFGLPGLGSMLIDAIGSGDVLTTQSIVMIYALIIVVVNVVADVMTIMLNPRIRFKD